jgi:hypothetical protein
MYGLVVSEINRSEWSKGMFAERGSLPFRKVLCSHLPHVTRRAFAFGWFSWGDCREEVWRLCRSWLNRNRVVKWWVLVAGWVC